MTTEGQLPGKATSLVIFVHGFNSGPECWDTLTTLMKGDAALTSQFHWECFDYQSKVLKGLFNMLSKVPDFDDITAKLDQYLCERFNAPYEELFLVGHSQGGLIIQAWLEKVIIDDARRLKTLRESIFLCTPTLGSTIATGARNVVFSLLSNPQERRLRVLDPVVAKTRRLVEERIVETSLRDSGHWTTPILSIWGQDDNVVSAVAAQASFDNVLTVDGDHSSVLKPVDRKDDRYTVLIGALLNPVGHRHVFEVERYETVIAVAPLADPNYVAKRGTLVENKQSDNYGSVTRRISFSAANTCVDLFRLNYQTGPAGFLQASFDEVGRKMGDAPPANEAPGDMAERWLRGENDITYDFRPVKGKTYEQVVEIWSGFDAGKRDVHFHFDGSARIREYRFTVDLTAYVAKGWTVSQSPKVYVDPAGTAEHEIGERRLTVNLVPAADGGCCGWPLDVGVEGFLRRDRGCRLGCGGASLKVLTHEQLSAILIRLPRVPVESQPNQ